MAEFKTASVYIRGLVPSIMNNGRKANPMDDFAKGMKAIYATKPRGGTLSEDQFEELLRLDFMGGLYVNEDGVPSWPGTVLEAMLLSAAKKYKRGNDAKVGLIVDGDWPLIYDGPKDPDELWMDRRFRNVCMAKPNGKPIVRCRPMFNQWELKFDVMFDPDVLDLDTLRSWVEQAGARIGLSDWRPKYGRFEVISIG